MFLSNLWGTQRGRNGTTKSNRPALSTSASERSISSSQSIPDVYPPEYLSDESQLQAVDPIAKELLELNDNLETLATLFPDVQVEVFREMLANFSEESKLFVVTDKLLKSPSTFVKGRRKAGHQLLKKVPLVPKTEAFRTKQYRAAVRALALQEFKGLSRSSINAVLSESNYSYLDARPTLVALSSKSWKFTISAFLFRRKPVTTVEAETHPLIVWKTSDDGIVVPSVKATGNAELDKELFDELIRPLRRRETGSREAKDRALAVSLHTEEAEACEATYECACCFTDGVFEEFTTCSSEGHMVCFRCVRLSITEAVFGQGWQRTINKDNGTLRCPAVSSVDCEGCVAIDHIQRAFREEKNGAEVLLKLDQRLAEHGLVASGLTLVRCPFCNYAEVDDLYLPDNSMHLKIRRSNIPNFIGVILCLVLFPITLPILASFMLSTLLFLNRKCREYVFQHYRAAITRYQRRKRGLRFICQNPACARPSCLSCSKAWVDIHVCHESSLIALRTQVEQAMSMAIKRVCPRCSTSFVKTAGCNKLTCPCGYKMCYVCRKDIGTSKEGYQHFCQHFRPEGDGRRCRECNKCNLWETENTEAILREAKAEAERKWKETERRDLSDAEKAYLENGMGGGFSGGGSSGSGSGKTNGDGGFVVRQKSVEDFYDILMDTLFI